MTAMDSNADEIEPMDEYIPPEPRAVVAEVVSEPVRQQAFFAGPRRPWVALPLILFVLTCLSTWFAGGLEDGVNAFMQSGLIEGVQVWLWQGLKYSAALMTILVCHEMGHFLQARRYGVYASYPYFIPMPISPIGTFGAVIAMQARMGDRRALFDIGISGPLVGLVPTLLCCILGLYWSEPRAPETIAFGTAVTEPLLFGWLREWICGPLPQDQIFVYHPLAFAGWVGLLVTSLNLMPIGQLDGGHVLYALLRQKANRLMGILLLAAAVAVVIYGLWGWLLMLVLVMYMGPRHPPTANDEEPLGLLRHALGWLTLAFIVVGFTPDPLAGQFQPKPPPEAPPAERPAEELIVQAGRAGVPLDAGPALGAGLPTPPRVDRKVSDLQRETFGRAVWHGQETGHSAGTPPASFACFCLRQRDRPGTEVDGQRLPAEKVQAQQAVHAGIRRQRVAQHREVSPLLP